MDSPVHAQSPAVNGRLTQVICSCVSGLLDQILITVMFIFDRLLLGQSLNIEILKT